ncbi:MAG: carotenoid biosynthesis protein [Ferruginibacter sp.]
MNILGNKEKIATIIAIVFHVIGLAGILFYNIKVFAALSWLNMLLMLALIIYTQKEITTGFAVFFISCFVVGIAVEIAGTSTGVFFGEYHYTDVLGYSIKHVPLIIGVNWFIVLFCAGVSIHMLTNNLQKEMSAVSPRWLKAIAIITDTALLAVFFDWLMEPAAIKLGFWQWHGDGTVPFYNYVSWLVVSAILAAVFYFCTFPKQNKFAVNLLLIQAMFFLLIRTFL